MKRREFLTAGMAALGYMLTPEGLWVPGQKVISIPTDKIYKGPEFGGIDSDGMPVTLTGRYEIIDGIKNAVLDELTGRIEIRDLLITELNASMNQTIYDLRSHGVILTRNDTLHVSTEKGDIV